MLFKTMLLGFLSSAAMAHGDMEKIQDALDAPHGGRLRLSGDYYIELVTSPRSLAVYVADARNKQPVDLGKSNGAAIVVSGGKKQMVDLTAEGHVLHYEGPFSSIENATIAVIVQLPDGTKLSGKYSPRNDRH